jgi:hypothetical protein
MDETFFKANHLRVLKIENPTRQELEFGRAQD